MMRDRWMWKLNAKKKYVVVHGSGFSVVPFPTVLVLPLENHIVLKLNHNDTSLNSLLVKTLNRLKPFISSPFQEQLALTPLDFYQDH